MVQEKIKNKSEGFGPLAPVFLEGAEFALNNQLISVEEDLPCNHKELMVTEEYSCNVFIACKDGYVSSDFIIKGFNKWYWNGDYDPDYWMFPPELPKEQE